MYFRAKQIEKVNKTWLVQLDQKSVSMMGGIVTKLPRAGALMMSILAGQNVPEKECSILPQHHQFLELEIEGRCYDTS